MHTRVRVVVFLESGQLGGVCAGRHGTGKWQEFHGGGRRNRMIRDDPKCQMMVERYPNLKEEVGGSILGCEISSLLDRKTCHVVKTATRALALACRPSVKKKKEKKRRNRRSTSKSPQNHCYTCSPSSSFDVLFGSLHQLRLVSLHYLLRNFEALHCLTIYDSSGGHLSELHCSRLLQVLGLFSPWGVHSWILENCMRTNIRSCSLVFGYKQTQRNTRGRFKRRFWTSSRCIK